jgi:hypothetical protein
MTTIFILILVVNLIVSIGMYWNLSQKEEIKQPTVAQFNVDLQPIKEHLDKLPSKVLSTIQGSTNNLKGDLGEYIGYLKLHAMYDRVIPLGSITDFIGIKLPAEDIEGSVDFIDIKTGSARLSKEQRLLQKLIEDKKVNLIKLTVQVNSGSSNENVSSKS